MFGEGGTQPKGAIAAERALTVVKRAPARARSTLARMDLVPLQRLFRVGAWCLLIVITAVTLSPPEQRPVTEAGAGLERLLAFGLLGGAFVVGYPRQRWLVMGLLLGGVGLLEAAQGLVPGRHARLMDATTKGLGVVAGSVLAWLVVSAMRSIAVPVLARVARVTLR